MEYSELHDKEVGRLNARTERRDASTKGLEEDRRILAKHLGVAESKVYDYALCFAYLDSDSDDEDENNGDGLQIARGIWEDRKLGHTRNLVEKKSGVVSKREEYIKGLKIIIARTKGLIKAIAMYNPSKRQARRKVVQDHFVFAKGRNWLDWNAERRREQEGRTNSRFKTFVDIFSRSNYRIFPKKEGRFGHFNLDVLPLDSVVVDPDRISDSFLASLANKKFGLSPVPKEKHPLDKLRAKEKMIPAVKQFFEQHVSPLNRAGWDDKDVNWRLLVVEGYHPRHDGKIINPRFVSREKPGERNKIMYVYKSAYSARRGSGYLYEYYEIESQVLYQILWNLKLVRGELILVKKGDSNESKVLRSAKKRLKELVAQLENPKDVENPRKPDNVYKSSAYKRLLTTIDLKDVKGRINKGASLAKLVAICNNLQNRLEEVDDISITGPQNNNTLNSEIVQSENVLSSYSDAFQAYLDVGNESRSMFKSLNGSLANIRVRPFNLYARRLQKCIKDMKAESDFDVKNDFARRGLAIANLFKIQKYVEQLITQNSKLLTKFTDVLYGQLENLVQYSNQLRVPDCEGVFKLFEDRLTEIKKEIKEALAKKYGMSPYNSKTMLKAIDFGEILRKAT